MTLTVDSYIAGLPEEAAGRVQKLRHIILEAAPGATETIKYAMPSFQLGHTYIVYLGAWKKHVALYPVARGTDDFETRLAPYRTERDTVRFLHTDDIPYDLVTEIVRARLKKLVP